MAPHRDPVAAPTELRACKIVALVVTGVAVTCIMVWSIACYQLLADPAHGGRNLDIDFSVFWGAAKLALSGDWLGPFETAKLSEARLIPIDREAYEMYWLYPPAYHIAIAPLGYLPFFWSWLAFGLGSLALLAWALAAPTRGATWAIALVVFSPSAMFLLALGQNSLLIAALLVGVLEAIRRNQVILAGLLIAAMTIKPQLGIAIPVALLAGSHWRVILWACIGTLALLCLTLVTLGPEYWQAFFQAMIEGGQRIRHSDLIRVMISGFGNAVWLGMDQHAAMALQLVLSVFTAGCLAWLWRHPVASFDLKAAGLCLSVLLMTPYAIHYELIFAVLAAFYLARDGVATAAPGRYLIVLLWLTPAIGYALLPWPGFSFTALLMLAALIYAIARAQGQLARNAEFETKRCPAPSASR